MNYTISRINLPLLMFLPGSTRLFCTSRFYVLAKTLEALLEIPFKKDIYQLEEDPNLQHFDVELERVPGDLILYGLNSFSIVCPGFFFSVFLFKSQECYSKLNFPFAIFATFKVYQFSMPVWFPWSRLRNLLLALWNLARAVELSLGAYTRTSFEDAIKATSTS